MHITVQNLINIKKIIQVKINELNYNNYSPKIIAVSKTFKIDYISHLIEHGHYDFGENKVQEAAEKWTEIKSRNSNIKLHMVGRLQSNKVKPALKIFDYIHSLDNLKLAKKISDEQKKYEVKPKLFIQINFESEKQKSGIDKNDLNDFHNSCKNLDLDVIGTMCIPPNDNKTEIYFSQMNDLSALSGLKELSMGMSEDYLISIKHKSTFLRIGSKIFGNRY